MSEKAKELEQAKTAEAGGAGMMLCRLMWMFMGPLILVIIIYRAVSQGDGWLRLGDAVYAIALALMIGARWLEMRSGTAMTATGEPATMRHFKRYVIVLLPVAAILWIAAKVTGNHVLH
jgi:hypothetical protein